MDRINVGIIGCGRISDLHLPGYRDNTSANLYALCDTNSEVGEQKRKEWGVEKLYSDYNELLGDPLLDAVEILSPQPAHEKMVIDAVASGKHIALQKPMTIDLPGADRILEVVSGSDLLFKVTDNYLFYPPIVLAKKLIDQGEIGTPCNLRIKMISGGSGGWTVPASAWAWRIAENLAGRGFQTFDHGHHLWAVAWYLMGGIERVTSWIDTVDGLVDSPAVIMWKYREGVAYGSCEYSHAHDLSIPSTYYANDEWFEITGSKGIIMVRRCTGNIVSGPGVSLFNGKGWRQFDEVKTDWREGFLGSTRNFVDAIFGKADPLLTGEQAREILKINLAISKSSTVRREVYVDELDAPVPWAYTKKRIREEIRRSKEKRKKGSSGSTETIDTHTIEAEAVVLTKNIAERIDFSEITDWKSTILLELSLGERRSPSQFVFRFQHGQFSVSQDVTHLKPDLTIALPARLWIEMLRGNGTIEEAFSSGDLEMNGEIEEALKLKKAIGM